MATTVTKKATRNSRHRSTRVQHQGHDFSLIIMRLSMGLLGLGSLLQASGFPTIGGLISAAGGACGVGSK